jgi:hypothetical protein
MTTNKQGRAILHLRHIGEYLLVDTCVTGKRKSGREKMEERDARCVMRDVFRLKSDKNN